MAKKVAKKKVVVDSVDESVGGLELMIWRFKPKSFTYDLSIEVDHELKEARVVNVEKSNIVIGLVRAVEFIGKLKIEKEVLKCLKDRGFEGYSVVGL